MKLGGFMSSYLKDNDILQVKRKLFEFKKTLLQIHFKAIVKNFVTKIISDFSYNTNKQHTKKYKHQ
jgi:DNA-directed RNA polymerase delta subunit